MQHITTKEININLKNLTSNNFNTISEELAEDTLWQNLRKKYFEKYTNLPFFFSRYTKISDFDFSLKLSKQYLVKENKYLHNFSNSLSKETQKKLEIKSIFLTDSNLLEKYLTSNTEYENQFQILANILFTSGFFLHLAENTNLEETIFLPTLKDQNQHFNLNLIVLEKNTTLNLFLQKNTENKNFNHLFAENNYIILGENAKLNLIKSQNLAENYFVIENNNFNLGPAAKINYFNFNLGASLSLNFNRCFLNDNNGDYTETEIILANHKQKFNTQSKIYHKAHYTKGYCTIKSVLTDKANSAFEGVAKIEKLIEGADSFVSSKGLLLSPTTRCNAIPALEIESSNIKAAHQATVDKISEEQLFFLTSRGLSEEESKKLLVESFIQAEVEKIDNTQIQNKLQLIIKQKLLDFF